MVQRTARSFLLLSLALLVVRPGAIAAASADVVAVLPMVVHSSDDRGQLREGLADMLASRLGRQPGISVLRLEDASLATTDPEAAAAAGRKAGATWVVFGSFTHFGKGASLDVRCVRADGSDAHDPRSIFIQSGTLGDIIPRLGGLTGRLGHYVSKGGERGADDVADSAKDSADAGATPNGAAELEELRLRVKALEAHVFSPGPGTKEDLARVPDATTSP